MRQPRGVLEETSADSNAVLDSYSVMMAEYPRENVGSVHGGSRLLDGMMSGGHAGMGSNIHGKGGVSSGGSGMMMTDGGDGNGNGSGLLNDSVDIRSCVLLGNPQPFRTWSGEIYTKPRDMQGTTTWLRKFAEHEQEISGGNPSGSSGGNGTAMGASCSAVVMHGNQFMTDNNNTNTTNNTTGSASSSLLEELPVPLASSREFRFRTQKGKTTRFADITAKRLKTHIRRFRQDTGFSLWMRKDVAQWTEDRSTYALERLNLKAQDWKIQTHHRYQSMDLPQTVLSSAHARISDDLEQKRPPTSSVVSLKNSYLLPAVEMSNERSVGHTKGGRLRGHGVSTINHLSSRRLATQPPPEKHKIVPFKEMSNHPGADMLLPEPLLNSSSIFSPLCGITSMRPSEKYRRRQVLPDDLPSADTVVGLGYEATDHQGKHAEEAAAVQASIKCAERNLAYKRKKIEAASRARSRGRC